MDSKSLKNKIKELRDRADRTENAVSGGNCSPSSQEWINPERIAHYRRMAAEARNEADKLERMLKK